MQAYLAIKNSRFVNFLSKTIVIFTLSCVMLLTSRNTSVAMSLNRDCAGVLSGGQRTNFTGPADEINYTNQFLSCWAQVTVVNSNTANHSYLGKGLQLFSDPAFVEALGFSQNLCDAGRKYPGSEYICWFGRETAQQNVSLEAAARQEVPKILFSDLQKARDATDIVQLTLCINDDPTKPKEYSKSCKRGYRASITEYGRGDFNGDKIEDILVTVKFGSNSDSVRKCYMAGFTRKDSDYFKMISFSPAGLCEW